MNIDDIAKRALTKLKLKYGIPEKGFIAGGALANLMWEEVSGTPAIINDIDVFVFKDEKEKDTIFQYKDADVEYIESYKFITRYVHIKNSYQISKTLNEGAFNYIEYHSSEPCPEMILDSFDINCTGVGFSIEENKFYVKKEFIEFLKTGDLKIINLTTPAHTAIRIVKKADELKARYEDFELDMCSFLIKKGKLFQDSDRIRFMKKYADIYNKYREKLNNFFELKRDIDLESYLLVYKSSLKEIYCLESKKDSSIFDSCISKPNNIPPLSKDFLFYVRKIMYDSKKKEVWDKLPYFYTQDNYLDINYEQTDVDCLLNLVNKHPKLIKSLVGMNLSEQVKLTKNIIDKVGEMFNYETAISVLENIKLNPNMEYDEDDCLILGLSVRKKINHNVIEIPF